MAWLEWYFNRIGEAAYNALLGAVEAGVLIILVWPFWFPVVMFYIHNKRKRDETNEINRKKREAELAAMSKEEREGMVAEIAKKYEDTQQ